MVALSTRANQSKGYRGLSPPDDFCLVSKLRKDTPSLIILLVPDGVTNMAQYGSIRLIMERYGTVYQDASWHGSIRIDTVTNDRQ